MPKLSIFQFVFQCLSSNRNFVLFICVKRFSRKKSIRIDIQAIRTLFVPNTQDDASQYVTIVYRYVPIFFPEVVHVYFLYPNLTFYFFCPLLDVSRSLCLSSSSHAESTRRTHCIVECPFCHQPFSQHINNVSERTRVEFQRRPEGPTTVFVREQRLYEQQRPLMSGVTSSVPVFLRRVQSGKNGKNGIWGEETTLNT